jgi:hypothetical protein
MQTADNGAATKPGVTRAEPRKLLKRIGSTQYEVSIHFSETSKETLEQKMLRLMTSEVNKNA